MQITFFISWKCLQSYCIFLPSSSPSSNHVTFTIFAFHAILFHARIKEATSCRMRAFSWGVLSRFFVLLSSPLGPLFSRTIVANFSPEVWQLCALLPFDQDACRYATSGLCRGTGLKVLAVPIVEGALCNLQMQYKHLWCWMSKNGYDSFSSENARNMPISECG